MGERALCSSGNPEGLRADGCLLAAFQVTRIGRKEIWVVHSAHQSLPLAPFRFTFQYTFRKQLFRIWVTSLPGLNYKEHVSETHYCPML